MRTAAFLLLIACIPAPLSLVGAPCDAEHPCGDGYLCTLSVCVSQEAKPPSTIENLLSNGSFETLPTVEWEPAPMAMMDWGSMHQGGTRCVSLQAGQMQTLPGLALKSGQLTSKRHTFYCADGFVSRTTGAQGSAEMFFRIGNTEATGTSVQVSAGAGWLKLTARAWAPEEAESVIVGISTVMFPKTDTLDADDLRVWLDPTGGCATP